MSEKFFTIRTASPPFGELETGIESATKRHKRHKAAGTNAALEQTTIPYWVKSFFGIVQKTLSDFVPHVSFRGNPDCGFSVETIPDHFAAFAPLAHILIE